MIRKHKVFAKSWELDQPKTVQPFPDGIAAHSENLPFGVAPDEWSQAMRQNSTWDRAADDLNWAIQMKATCSAIENVTYAVDSVLAKVEDGQTLDLLTLHVIKEKFDTVVELMTHHEEAVLQTVFPFLEPRLTEKEAKSVKGLQKAYSQRQKRAGLVTKALEMGIKKLNATEETKHVTQTGPRQLQRSLSGTGQGVFIMRLLKDSFDVFQSVVITAMQMEGETVLWLVRSKMTGKEWQANSELGTKIPWDVEKLGFLACQDSEGLLQPISLADTARRLSSHLPYPLAYASGCLLCAKHQSTWTKPLQDVVGTLSDREAVFKEAQ